MAGLHPWIHRYFYPAWWTIFLGGTLQPQIIWEVTWIFMINIILNVGQDKIYRLDINISEYVQRKHGLGIYPIFHCRVFILIINPPFLHDPIDAQVEFVLYEHSICVHLPLKVPHWHDSLFQIHFSSLNQVLLLIILMCTDLFSIGLHKLQNSRLNDGFI